MGAWSPFIHPQRHSAWEAFSQQLPTYAADTYNTAAGRGGAAWLSVGTEGLACVPGTGEALCSAHGQDPCTFQKPDQLCCWAVTCCRVGYCLCPGRCDTSASPGTASPPCWVTCFSHPLPCRGPQGFSQCFALYRPCYGVDALLRARSSLGAGARLGAAVLGCHFGMARSLFALMACSEPR